MSSLSSLAANLANLPGSASRMPVLFMGHGSPMNAIEQNPESDTWKKLGKNLPRPKAILCVSAHWETNGVQVTAMPKPRTIHDFGGFPKALFDVQYPAPGDPALAGSIQKMLATREHVHLDHHWGLDHGAWSVIRQMFPEANLPVLQLSLNTRYTPAQHYTLARDLQKLREQGVLIISSGNWVHNLGILDWKSPNGGYDWAVEINQKIKQRILSGDDKPLVDYPSLGKEARLAIPTPEHYLPLLYTLGLRHKDETPWLFNDVLQMGSLSMASVAFGFSQ